MANISARFALAALLLVGIGCSTSPTEPKDHTVSLRYGESAFVGNTRVTFIEVVDSRCPKDVQCPWAGDAAIRLESGDEYVVLHTNSTAGPSTGKLAQLNVSLLTVEPDPLTSAEVKKSAYRVTLRVSA